MASGDPAAALLAGLRPEPPPPQAAGRAPLPPAAGSGGRSLLMRPPPPPRRPTPGSSLLKRAPRPRPSPPPSSPRPSLTPELLRLERALNVDHVARAANALKVHSHPDWSDEEGDVLLAAESEWRQCPATKAHALALRRMRPRRRKLDLRREEGDEDELDFLDRTTEAEQDRMVQELLDQHVKRKRMLKRAETADEDTVEEDADNPSLPPLGLSSDRGLAVNKFVAVVERKRRKVEQRDPAATTAPTTAAADALRRRLWVAIAKKEIPRAVKARAAVQKERAVQCKKTAGQCMKVVRQKAVLSQKRERETIWRAKRIAREVQAYWKRFDRVEKQQKRQQEKEAEEQMKLDVQILEAKRQQRKLNFLITQTELYAHFIQKKHGQKPKEEEEGGSGEDAILSRLQENGEKKLAIDDYDSAVAQEQARRNASDAAMRQKEKTEQFFSTGEEEKPVVASDAREQPSMFRGTLKSYQLKGMSWLVNLYDQGINGILADEMGLGKTVQSLAMLAYIAEKYHIWGPFLVITPASTLHNWQQEVAKFVPSFKLVPYWGSPQERKTLRHFWDQKNLHTKNATFHIVITSYQLVISDFKFFNRVKWQYLVLDEAQAIKSSSSQRWKMLLSFKCRNRLLLSGTPIQNTMAELWSLLHFVMPTLFDSHEEFNDWFSRDIESSAESKGKVDEKQISRLHMILKPFMLRRIKRDVENELTDKVEVLVYCPLTIRQQRLYRGLKKKIRVEELLQQGERFSTSKQQESSVTSSLMNLVMQFRKVCNHPELFERREPRSPLAMKTADFIVPKMLTRSVLRDESLLHLTHNKLSVFNVHHVHRSLFHRQRGKVNKGGIVKLEEPAEDKSSFSYLRFVGASLGEQEAMMSSPSSVLKRLHHIAAEDSRRERLRHRSVFWEGSPIDLLVVSTRPKVAMGDLVFTSRTRPFLGHVDVRLCPMRETEAHRLMRVRNRHLIKSTNGCDTQEAAVNGDERKPRWLKCQAEPAPTFLTRDSFPAVAASGRREYAFDRAHAHRMALNAQTHRDVLTLGLNPTPKWRLNKSFIDVGSSDSGLWGCRPEQGFSNVVIPCKQTLVSDSGKLHALDGLLTRLKACGHRVLVYSQMTKMIDLLEEFMWHRKHSFIRLDGSSKISDRRDMVADFQERTDIFVFLLSTRAGGLGINLTAADTVIFYDSDWNPTVDQQAMDRAHRLGQTKQVTVYRLVCKGTIEERILQRAREKSEIQRMVIQGGSFKGGQQAKGQQDQLRPKEVVSLLLDDEEIELKYRARQDGGAKGKGRSRKAREEEEEDVEVDIMTDGDESSVDASTLMNPAASDWEDSSSSRDVSSSRPPSPLLDFMGESLGPKRQRKRGLGGGRRGRPPRGGVGAAAGIKREAVESPPTTLQPPPAKRGPGRPRIKPGAAPLNQGSRQGSPVKTAREKNGGGT